VKGLIFLLSFQPSNVMIIRVSEIRGIRIVVGKSTSWLAVAVAYIVYNTDIVRAEKRQTVEFAFTVMHGGGTVWDTTGRRELSFTQKNRQAVNYRHI
jgi:hypothetical protein